MYIDDVIDDSTAFRLELLRSRDWWQVLRRYRDAAVAQDALDHARERTAMPVRLVAEPSETVID